MISKQKRYVAFQRQAELQPRGRISAHEAKLFCPSSVSAAEQTAGLSSDLLLSRSESLRFIPSAQLTQITADFKGNQILQVPKNENNKRHRGRQIPLEIIGDYPKEVNAVQARYQM